ncbi:MAG: fructosamine kinase family protein [Tepidisphaeraceae bacterium]
MSNGDVDISWQSLRRIVQDWAGTAAELSEFVPLHGGQINTTLDLHLKDGNRLVIKVSPHRVDKSYEREAYQLTLLKSCGVPVPEVYRWKIGSLDDPFSYILLEFVEGVGMAEAKQQTTPEEFDALQVELAELVGKMHDNVNAKYMRVMEGGDSYESWPAFYRAVYDPIWQEAEKEPLLSKHCRKQIGRIHERLDRLVAHHDQPRLVHWDLWNTNILVRRSADGKWRVAAVLDPNCKFAHAEAEIAYLEMFHTVTPAFMKRYQQHHKLPPEYHQFRKPIYQLYPMINHVRLYGESYLKPLTAALERTNHLV